MRSLQELIAVVLVFLCVVLSWCFEFAGLSLPVDSVRRLLAVVATREDWSAWLLMLELVEALGCHVEILNLKLLNPLPEHSVHLPHMDQLAVNLIHSRLAVLSWLLLLLLLLLIMRVMIRWPFHCLLVRTRVLCP